ncbi:uncharacterized protein LOC123312261 isoform X2 [Coccinella septempunctata]|uniref:uncharacterized protein LOC123312261 isoform X2 n=1 Tax=Coccinella septempunctata TaxID=41139 RepID=UPI001D096827|nr:uncharacterized protein LOC123312261 isoform X2 [Coccinella septempunctata]
MCNRIWYTSENGDIEIRSLTKEYLKESLELLQDVFFMEETTATACGLPNNPEARKEWGEICLAVANEGVSVVAIDTKENRVAAVAFNKIYCDKTDDGECSFYERYSKVFKTQSAKDLIICCERADSVTDLFSKCGCNCYLELMFLATAPKYKGKQLATKLATATIALAKQLHIGENVKQSLTDVMLPNEPRPGAVVAVFTSNISQKLAEKLEFQIAGTLSYREIARAGKTYYELLDKRQEKCLIVFKKL